MTNYLLKQEFVEFMEWTEEDTESAITKGELNGVKNALLSASLMPSLQSMNEGSIVKNCKVLIE